MLIHSSLVRSVLTTPSDRPSAAPTALLTRSGPPGRWPRRQRRCETPGQGRQRLDPLALGALSLAEPGRRPPRLVARATPAGTHAQPPRSPGCCPLNVQIAERTSPAEQRHRRRSSAPGGERLAVAVSGDSASADWPAGGRRSLRRQVSLDVDDEPGRAEPPAHRTAHPLGDPARPRWRPRANRRVQRPSAWPR